MPVQLPGSAVNTFPSWDVPEIAGGELFTGGAGAAATTAVCAEPAEPEPTVLVALMLTRTVDPTSAELSVYVWVAAPTMSTQLAPALSQRRH